MCIRDRPIDPYTLGSWLGDGDSRTGILTTADTETLEYIPYNSWKMSSGKYRYRIEGLTKLLNKQGLLKDKHIPDEYLSSSISQRESLLQGLIDTDGSVHKTNSNLTYTTVSPKLRDGVCDLVRSLGGKVKVHDNYTKVSKEATTYHHSYLLNIWLPDEITPCRLTRKLNRRKFGQRLKSAIKAIEPVGVKKGRCITVENSNGIYLTNDYLVTHNSHCIATYCAWRITVNPWWTVLYVSASDSLAKAQMGVIQNILLSDEHRLLWPDMLNFQKNQYGELVHKPLGNNVWTQEKIMVDHPARKERSVRDATLAIKSVGSSKTGLHANEIVFDDLVTDENYKSEVKRNEVVDCYTNMVKIATTSSLMKAVGTRYADNDLYGLLKESTYPVYEDGVITNHAPLWQWFEKVVEDSPHRDGTGTYLWPKQWNEQDGRFYGFDQQELAIKKANQTMSGDSRQLELWHGQYYKPQTLSLIHI